MEKIEMFEIPIHMPLQVQINLIRDNITYLEQLQNIMIKSPKKSYLSQKIENCVDNIYNAFVDIKTLIEMSNNNVYLGKYYTLIVNLHDKFIKIRMEYAKWYQDLNNIKNNDNFMYEKYNEIYATITRVHQIYNILHELLLKNVDNDELMDKNNDSTQTEILIPKTKYYTESENTMREIVLNIDSNNETINETRNKRNIYNISEIMNRIKKIKKIGNMLFNKMLQKIKSCI